MNTWEDLIPIVLLILIGTAVGGGATLIYLARRVRARELRERKPEGFTIPLVPTQFRSAFLQRPNSWLAIRSRNPGAIQAALGLNNPTPCTWTEGVSGDKRLFIGPPIKNWILVTGAGLPEPGEDVDACFRFLIGLSQKLGEVQFFNANRALNHHAWVRLEGGRVRRAYAWADKTLWNQGIKTRAELELAVRCFGYLEAPQPAWFGVADVILSNTEKVPALAERWSLDPAHIDERILDHALGIAGEPSHLY